MLALADLWSTYSTCVRRQVGAVLFHPETHAVVGIGYNDTPIGEDDCGEGGCEPCSEGSVKNRTDCKCVHAEMNAVLLAQRVDGCWLATTYHPCIRCHNQLIQAGVKAVVYRKDCHPDKDMVCPVAVEFLQLPPEPIRAAHDD